MTSELCHGVGMLLHDTTSCGLANRRSMTHWWEAPEGFRSRGRSKDQLDSPTHSDLTFGSHHYFIILNVHCFLHCVLIIRMLECFFSVLAIVEIAYTERMIVMYTLLALILSPDYTHLSLDCT